MRRGRMNPVDAAHAVRRLKDLSVLVSALASATERTRMREPRSHDRPARQLHGAATVLGASVLMDSAVEHYRGSFKNTAMVLPLISSALNIVSGLHGISASESDSHKGRTLAYLAAIGIGTIGTGFHVYNVTKRVGGVRWENFFYGAPLGAPAALMLSGMAGLAADRLAGNAKRRGEATLFDLPAGRVLAAFTSLGLIGTVGEAGLLHFRGNFQNPAMYLPVVLPPVAAVVMAEAALGAIASQTMAGANLPWDHFRYWLRRRRLSLLRRVARDGRLEKLATERCRWAPDSGASKLCRTRPWRHCRADPDREGRAMTGRFPGYDVLKKRNTLSWNEPTRRAVDKRIAVHPGPRFFSEPEWKTLVAICARIVPQPTDRPPVPIPAYVDQKMFENVIDGYRFDPLLPQGEAWKAALAAIDAEASERCGAAFHALTSQQQDELLSRMQKGELEGPLWRGMPSDLVFHVRVLHDITGAYYAHPTAWSEIGWAGPASPRGFVRLDKNMRDPWEAAEAYAGKEARARRENDRVV